MYCGAVNPDSEETCSETGGRHTLISSADKENMGQGYEHGPKADFDPLKQSSIHVAHGFTGDDSVIRHCPLCGSGDVWGGSDGSVQCNFCNHAFSVQVQPEYPQAAQNLDGTPLGIDGQAEGYDEDGNPIDDGTGDEGGEAPGFLGGPEDGGEAPDGSGGPQEGSPEDEEDQGKENPIPTDEDDDDDDDEDEDDDDEGPPAFLKKKSVRTGWPAGARLDRHFLAPVEDGGHGWDDDQLNALSPSWRQERHDWAHGLGALPLHQGSEHWPDDPGHEHWSPDETDNTQHQRYRTAALYITATGVLDHDDLINHLAIRHADDRDAVVAAVREFNLSRGD